MDIATVAMNLLLKGLDIYSEHINDPTVRFNAREEVKLKLKQAILEIVAKETDVEKANELALALLASLDTL